MRCPARQHDNPARARFCNGCGASLTAANPAPAPQSYTPPHLADKILTSGGAMRREQLDQDLRDWGFGVAPRRLG